MEAAGNTDPPAKPPVPFMRLLRMQRSEWCTLFLAVMAATFNGVTLPAFSIVFR